MDSLDPKIFFKIRDLSVKGSPVDLILLGAIVLVGMQPGGRGGVKKGQKTYVLSKSMAPREVLNNFPQRFSNSKNIEI